MNINYTIYVKPINLNYFRDVRNGESFGNYVGVYRGTVEADDINAAANKLWDIFNIDRPEHYAAHSMSVGDIIRFDEDDKFRWLAVASFGFTKIDIDDDDNIKVL